ncbi:hypothetical protein NSK_002948 [Nannochloropsis salina CCMP1776]|uniref:Uncharacterized protein n=1 Tax=Nannochloropsis salina CCMP1776 TaxID=1027361 RepID=A0A4D9D9Y4_9STRA|nr:hypothetical protein NSK_002948 [Nannochloropsis salina CCMP1776]|eukprot:TFJ85438.1 hypothetical protein NSK_002948 [Nannochloropsis salina CCMP1776]
MKLSVALTTAAASISLASAFLPLAPRPSPGVSRTSLAAWTPDRAPTTNLGRGGLSADASFDRAGVRADVDYMDNDQQARGRPLPRPSSRPSSRPPSRPPFLPFPLPSTRLMEDATVTHIYLRKEELPDAINP